MLFRYHFFQKIYRRRWNNNFQMQKLQVSQFKEVKKPDIDNDIIDIVQKEAKIKMQAPQDTIIINNARSNPKLAVKSGIVMLLTTYYYSQCLNYEHSQDHDERDQENWERFKSQQEMFKRMKDGKMLLTIQKNLPFFNRNQKLTYDFLDFYKQEKLIDLLKTFSKKTIEVTFIQIKQEKQIVQNQEEIQFVFKSKKIIPCQPNQRCFHFIICNLLTQDEPETYMFLAQLNGQQQIKNAQEKKIRSNIQGQDKNKKRKPDQHKISKRDNNEPNPIIDNSINSGIQQQKKKNSIFQLFSILMLFLVFLYCLDLKVFSQGNNFTQMDSYLYIQQSNSNYTKQYYYV